MLSMGLLSGASPHCRPWEATVDDRRATLLRHVCKDRQHVAVCGALALRRLDRRTRCVMTASSQVSSITKIANAQAEHLVIVGARLHFHLDGHRLATAVAFTNS